MAAYMGTANFLDLQEQAFTVKIILLLLNEELEKIHPFLAPWTLIRLSHF